VDLAGNPRLKKDGFIGDGMDDPIPSLRFPRSGVVVAVA
jgi:hypothetical protein